MASPKRILIVDDEQALRDMLATILNFHGHETETAQDGFEALAKVKLDIDLVLTDIQMPGMDGFEVVRRIREDADVRDIPICVVTGNTSKEDQLRAVQAGASDFICKPVDEIELRIRTASLLRQKEAQDAIKIYQKELEAKIDQRTASLRKALDEMVAAQRQSHQAHLDTIRRLVIAAEYKDECTGNHIQRISLICEFIALKLNLPANDVELIRLASPMHDVGKLGIPDHILLKPAKLTVDEYEIIKKHTTIGASILNDSASELIQTGEIIALSHHEKWNGKGYPKQLKGEDIPLSGRICALADVYDALSSKRPYKEAFPHEKVIEIIREEKGKHFDPDLTDLFCENLDEILKLTKEYE